MRTKLPNKRNILELKWLTKYAFRYIFVILIHSMTIISCDNLSHIIKIIMTIYYLFYYVKWEITLDAKSGKFSAVETISCCFLVETRMLNQDIPVRVVSIIVVVWNCKLHPPMIQIVVLEMPMDSNWTHVVSAFNYAVVLNLIIWPSQGITWPSYIINYN